MVQNKYLPNGEECLPKEEKFGEKQKGKSWIKGETKPTLDGGKHPSKCKWFNLLIFANLCLL